MNPIPYTDFSPFDTTWNFLNPPMVTTQIRQNPLRPTKSGFYGVGSMQGCNCGGSGMARVSPVLRGMGSISGGLAAAATDSAAVTDGSGMNSDMAYREWIRQNPGWVALYGVSGTIGLVAGVYHGWRRNQSYGWALWWGLMGAWFPFLTIPLSLAQGFGDRR